MSEASRRPASLDDMRDHAEPFDAIALPVGSLFGDDPPAGG